MFFFFVVCFSFRSISGHKLSRAKVRSPFNLVFYLYRYIVSRSIVLSVYESDFRLFFRRNWCQHFRSIWCSPYGTKKPLQKCRPCMLDVPGKSQKNKVLRMKLRVASGVQTRQYSSLLDLQSLHQM